MMGCIIQARMGSSRLPGKVMMKIDGEHSIMSSVITQLKYCKFLDKIVVATTNLQEDNCIEQSVLNLGIPCFRGSSLDVLDRFYYCAQKFNFSSIVRITSDNPLIDPTIVDETIHKFNSNSYDFVLNCLTRTFPYGTEVEIFSFDALKKSWETSKTSEDREHVTRFFYNNPDKFKIQNITYQKNLSHLKWTVDRENDLNLVRKIISKINKRPILMTDILQLFEIEPTLFEIYKE